MKRRTVIGAICSMELVLGCVAKAEVLITAGIAIALLGVSPAAMVLNCLSFGPRLALRMPRAGLK